MVCFNVLCKIKQLILEMTKCHSFKWLLQIDLVELVCKLRNPGKPNK